jgi:hypothetical protein
MRTRASIVGASALMLLAFTGCSNDEGTSSNSAPQTASTTSSDTSSDASSDTASNGSSIAPTDATPAAAAPSDTGDIAVPLGTGDIAVPLGTGDIPPPPVTADLPYTVSVTVGIDSSTSRIERVPLGATVSLSVTNPDAVDEFHLHGYDLGDDQEMPAGQTATFTFVATEVGSFELESHATGDVLMILEVV